MKIKDVKGRQILDSRGNPTVEVDIKVDDDSEKSTINEFTQNMLARDSIALRNHIKEIAPDIDLTSEVEMGGETVSVSIPLTVEFFWPQSI